MGKSKPPVERNDVVELTVDALGSEGQGIGRVEGYAVFIPGALPGERVRAHIIKAGSGFGVGKLTKLLSINSDRVYPPCAQFGRCGGCTLQHLAYPAELAYKRQQVLDALTRIGGFRNVSVMDTIGMMGEPWQYRNKGSFPLALTGGQIEAGFFAPRSHRLISTPDCLIQKPAVVLAAQAVKTWANEWNVSAYDEETGKGLLRHCMARITSSGDVMAVVVASGVLPKQKELIDELRDKVEGLKSIYLNINKDKTNVIFGEDYRLLWGEARITEELCSLLFSISPASFLQVNASQAVRLYETTAEFLNLTPGERVLDAYCGIGTISLLLAKKGGEVVGVESVPAAVEDARTNAALNGIMNARFVCAPAEEALPRLLKEGYMPAAIVADPPRKGCEPAFLQAVIESGVERMVYVSCNPATLARDCATLAEGGFQITRVQPVDLFPQTTHVETIVLLQRGNL